SAKNSSYDVAHALVRAPQRCSNPTRGFGGGSVLPLTMKLHGIFPPIATPFDHEGNIYSAKVRHNVEKWNRTTLSGYVVCGSTGESVMLTADEKAQLWGLVAEHAASDKLLIAGTGVESVRETVCLTNRAASMGYKAAMVRTPHYYKSAISRPGTHF